MPAFPALLENPRDLELIGFALGLVFWVQMIRLCATREAPSLERNLWLAFIILVPGLGSLLYFFLRLPRLRA
jgi:hypothetical protein